MSEPISEARIAPETACAPDQAERELVLTELEDGSALLEVELVGQAGRPSPQSPT